MKFLRYDIEITKERCVTVYFVRALKLLKLKNNFFPQIYFSTGIIFIPFLVCKKREIKRKSPNTLVFLLHT